MSYFITLLKLITIEFFNYYRVNYYIAKISVTMAAALITTMQIKVFGQSIFTIITYLKKNKRADINSIHSEIIKPLNFKSITNNIFRIELILS